MAKYNQTNITCGIIQSFNTVNKSQHASAYDNEQMMCVSCLAITKFALSCIISSWPLLRAAVLQALLVEERVPQVHVMDDVYIARASQSMCYVCTYIQM